MTNKTIKNALTIFLLILFLYGSGRLYFYLTDGFSMSHISSSLAYQPQWEVQPLSKEENQEAQNAYKQNYYYLGKGFQSYAFVSEDNHYVLKFFKYQYHRPRPWLAYLPSLPVINAYRQKKAQEKWMKLNALICSWKTTYDHLKDESAMVALHLNKTQHLNQKVDLYDKLGFKHQIDLDQMEFCLQRKGELLETVLITYREQKQNAQAKALLKSLLEMIISEYKRGIMDTDYALMQNTGVVDGKPMHIDLGEFCITEKVKEHEFMHLELLKRTCRLNQWLQKNYPEIQPYFDQELKKIIGEQYDKLESS